MKTMYQLNKIILCGLISTSFFISCGKDDVAAAVDNYIPDLSAAGWVNVSDANDILFFFNTPAQGSATGTFSGNRNGTAETGGFTGSFSNSAITLTFNSGSNSGRVFSGAINGSTTPVVISISTPASGVNAAVSLKFKR